MTEFRGLMLGQPGVTTAAEISIETGSAYSISLPPYVLDSMYTIFQLIMLVTRSSKFLHIIQGLS